ncbi:sulfur carrier protein ThiS [Oleisolibacter albus]|uniref:sulfur carrier protein ThiS n=1 Tax=Oleisolibacter albus TaxID=2171757 RepID=UPI000DF152C8|nr:sulfur carrier protein ThiS [Oleisolibacter albus]
MIRVNGKDSGRAPGPLLALLAELGYGLDSRGIAVAVNGGVVPRARWTETALADGDTVEVVKVLQGG